MKKYLIALLIGLVLFSGCSVYLPPTTTHITITHRNRLSGYVYVSGGRVVLSDSPVPPRGYEPLIYADVVLERGVYGSRVLNGTDRKGYFEFDEVPRGTNTLIIDHYRLLEPRYYTVDVR